MGFSFCTVLGCILVNFHFIVTSISGQSCIPKHCSCTINNTTAVPAQPFNVDSLDWQPIALATALGVLTSSLVLTSMAAWWTWKTNNIIDTQSLPSERGKQRYYGRNSRSISPSDSSDGSWASPKNS